MKFGLLLALAIVLLIALIYIRRKGQVEQTRPEPIKSPGSKKSAFHAVSIVFESDACASAKEMAGRRFLASAAPRLPLQECNALECKCKFKHHDDRRSGKDRRSPFSPGGFSAATGRFEAEKRKGPDRRKSADPDDPF